MTFLSPFAGIIAGVVGLSGLAVFYILKLRRRPVVVSSTLLWQRAVKDLQVNTPFQRFRSNLLFFVQLLAVLLVAGAIGRPALNAGGPAPAFAVIVIDHSASMNALETPVDALPSDRRTRLDNAKLDAARLARDLLGSRTSRVAVVTFTARARTASPFTTDLTTVLESIEAIRPTDQPSDLVPALALLDTLSLGAVEDDERGDAPAVVAYLFTDARDPGGLSVSANVDVRPQPVGHRAARSPNGSAGADTNTATSASNPAPPHNVGIAAIAARRDYNDPSLVRVFLRVVASSAPSALPIAELRLDGSIIAAQLVELRPDEADDAPAPFTAETVFTFENTAGGLVTARLPGSDALAADDSASLVLSPSRRARVLLVSPSRELGESGEQPAQQDFDARSRLARPDLFLLNALDVLDVAQLLVVDLAAYESSARSAVGLAELSRFDLVVFDRVEPSRLPPGSSTLSLGAGLPTLGISVVEQREGDADYVYSTPFLTWRRTDPLLRHVSLDTVLVAPPMLIRAGALRDDGAAGNDSRDGADMLTTQRVRTTTLATGPVGPMMVRAERAGSRHVVVGFDPARSTWGPDISFLIFMTNIVEQLGGGAGGAGGAGIDGAGGGEQPGGGASSNPDARGGYVLTTDAVQVFAAPGVQRVRVLTLDGSVVASAAVADRETIGVDDSPAPASLGVIDRAGVFQLEGSSQQPPVLAVNLLSAGESSVRPSGPIVLTGRTLTPTFSGETTPREVRWWFVLAAAGLLLFEWMLFAWRMRGG